MKYEKIINQWKKERKKERMDVKLIMGKKERKKQWKNGRNEKRWKERKSRKETRKNITRKKNESINKNRGNENWIIGFFILMAYQPSWVI